MPARIDDPTKLSEIITLLENLPINIERNCAGTVEGVMMDESNKDTTFFFIDFSQVAIDIWVRVDKKAAKAIKDAIAINRRELTVHVEPFTENSLALTKEIHALGCKSQAAHYETYVKSGFG